MALTGDRDTFADCEKLLENPARPPTPSFGRSPDDDAGFGPSEGNAVGGDNPESGPLCGPEGLKTPEDFNAGKGVGGDGVRSGPKNDLNTTGPENSEAEGDANSPNLADRILNGGPLRDNSFFVTERIFADQLVVGGEKIFLNSDCCVEGPNTGSFVNGPKPAGVRYLNGDFEHSAIPEERIFPDIGEGYCPGGGYLTKEVPLSDDSIESVSSGSVFSVDKSLLIKMGNGGSNVSCSGPAQDEICELPAELLGGEGGASGVSECQPDRSDGSDSGLGSELTDDRLKTDSLSSSDELNGWQVSSRKSTLKRPATKEVGEVDSPRKKEKKSIAFGDVSVYYFQRAQGFTCVPSQRSCLVVVQYTTLQGAVVVTSDEEMNSVRGLLHA
ncbi:hypothetical protein AAG570_001621 [Ranatra chinensis]|uniref:Cysteine/serine-rich nuclear protein N-terminal domain-containing protein n=1 Tax=Ranatra chinensis TaxID=642074 RepID=A0ABD0Y924_9HEMI